MNDDDEARRRADRRQARRARRQRRKRRRFIEHFIFTCIAAIITIIFIFISVLLIVLALLPKYMEDLLLTNDELCYTLLAENNDGIIGRRPIHFGEYHHENYYYDYREDDIDMTQRILNDRNEESNASVKGQQFLNQILYGMIWNNIWDFIKTMKQGDDSCKDESPQLPQNNDDNAPRQQQTRSLQMHPICTEYRRLRTRIRFNEIHLPFPWYLRNSFHIRGLTFHSLLDNVTFVERPKKETSTQHPWLTIGKSIIVGKDVVVNTVDNTKPINSPPSLEIDSVDVAFQSWSRPVVSVQLHGITINIVIQKGGNKIPLPPRKRYDKRLFYSSGPREGFYMPFTADNTGSDKKYSVINTILIGDMTIPQVLQLLPKPPEFEGIYPMIGVVNITNVTLCVYEKKDSTGDTAAGSSSPSSSLNLMLKMKVPDKFFLPISNLTLSHQHTGIDRKHFQPMMEKAVSHALRGHFIHEAKVAFRNSLISANKAQEQLQQFMLQAQEIYLDRWIGVGVSALHKTQENVWRGVVDGTAPLMKAIEECVVDLKEIALEPIPPLAVIVSHHWNRTMDALHLHSSLIDKQIWSHLNTWLTSKVKLDRRGSKHLMDEIRAKFDSFVAKSGHEIELLVKSCELEAKEMWLTWHRQFMPEL